MSYADVKFIESARIYLRNFCRKSSNLYNFSCWYCGDSEKNPRKARAYLIERNGSYGYYCHNCNKATSLKYFLKDLDYSMYQEYVKECLTGVDSKQITPDILGPQKSPKPATSPFYDLPSINDLDQYHHAAQFLKKREIPQRWYSDLRYTANFREFTNLVIPGKFEFVGKSDARIVIPFFDERGVLVGYQGRALYKTDLRYITIMMDESRAKIWNCDKCDFTKPFFVTEGPLDGMFLSNAIAMAGADFHLIHGEENAIIVYDNEPRNLEMIKKYEKKIDENFKICIWPDHIEEKDINDMVLAHYKPEEIIRENLYRGLSAKVKLNEWKRI